MNANKAPARNAKSGDQRFVTLLAIMLIIGAAVIGYVVSRPKAQAVVREPNAPLPAPQGFVAGDPNALVEIIEFADFECPGCGQFATITEPDVRRLIVNAGLARFRYIDWPFPNHPSSIYAHNAAHCAAAQNKFWEMHDRIYFGQMEWSEMANGRDMNAPNVLKRYAKELGLDTKSFDACLDSRQFEPQIRANHAEGDRLGVHGTPSFFVGRRASGGATVPTYDEIKAMVDTALAEARAAKK